MKIRKSTPEDIKQILSIYAYARSQMKRSGNPDQWKDHYPRYRGLQKISRKLPVCLHLSVAMILLMSESKTEGG